ncbi:hypothetical protein [Marisediminicola sp. LYQ134]|uniref:hypothetical protein n=1 Tax=unclassified Marisediminicola TaxID=2618316 RepID=UPI0039837D18
MTSATPREGQTDRAAAGADDPRVRSERRRRVTRRVLLIGFAPVAIAALILAGKLATLAPTADRAIEHYDSGAFDESATTSEGLLTGNAFEPWIAYFDRGTAYARGGLLNEAVDDLERAFATAPDSTRCDVAVNLSLSWELLGDSYVEQGFLTGAQRLYEAAQAVIDEAGEECTPPEAPPNEREGREAGEELDAADSRLEAKTEGLERVQPSGDEPESSLEEQLDELGELNDEGAREKSEQLDRDRGQSGPPGFVERPW